MFELNRAIEQWRRELRSQGSFTDSSLDELEDHLRADVAERVEEGASTERAFAAAVAGLGSSAELAHEFDKVRPATGRRLRMAGWALYAVSFFLPVYQWGVLWTHDAIRGWEAFVMSLDPEIGVYGIVSGLTNWLMLATLLPRWRYRRSLGRMLVVATLVNAGWLAAIDSVRALHVGFYAWWMSFALVAAAAWVDRRRGRRPAPMAATR